MPLLAPWVLCTLLGSPAPEPVAHTPPAAAEAVDAAPAASPAGPIAFAAAALGTWSAVGLLAPVAGVVGLMLGLAAAPVGFLLLGWGGPVLSGGLAVHGVLLLAHLLLGLTGPPLAAAAGLLAGRPFEFRPSVLATVLVGWAPAGLGGLVALLAGAASVTGGVLLWGVGLWMELPWWGVQNAPARQAALQRALLFHGLAAAVLAAGVLATALATAGGSGGALSATVATALLTAPPEAEPAPEQTRPRRRPPEPTFRALPDQEDNLIVTPPAAAEPPPAEEPPPAVETAPPAPDPDEPF